MRQTAPRRPPETNAVRKGEVLKIAAGEHLDLGMTVSVHCPGSARAAPACAAAVETSDDGGPGFIEH